MCPYWNNRFSGFIIHLRRTGKASYGLRLLVLFSVLFLNLAQNWSYGRAAVDLRSFSADGADRLVRVRWETASEFDISAFYVQRSNLQSSGYQRISEPIFSKSDQASGAKYAFDDQDVENGVTYYYKLEVVDPVNHSDFYGPVSAVPQAPTLTPTITQTGEASPTPSVTFTPSATSSTGASSTPTPTSTRLPASVSTDTPVPSFTYTPEATTTVTPTLTITSTPTFLPLPSITLIYPSPTATLTPTRTPLPAVTADASGSSGSTGSNELVRIGLIISIALLWVLLAGWLYIFFYRGRL
jgi:hypothetical protein